MVDEPDYYTLLGVAHDSDDEAIRQAYRRLARLYHPDVVGTGSLARMQQLNAAYQALSDPERRRAYDAHRVPAGHPRPSPERASGATTTHSQPGAARAGSVRVTSGPLRQVATLESPDSVALVAVAFTANVRHMALGLIDGRVMLWDVASGQRATTLSFGGIPSAGVLQQVRLSPSGALAAAWGFQIGTRVWHVGEGRTLWNVGMSAPAGMFDAILLDAPPFIRLVAPDAPLSLADEDPFRWAYDGRGGTDVLTRPLSGPVSPQWATPLRCLEAGSRFRDSQREGWHVRQRLLAHDGRQLLTFATRSGLQPPGSAALHLWDLDHRTLRGMVEPRPGPRAIEREGTLHFPIAATPALEWVAAGSLGNRVRLMALRDGQQRVLDVGALADDARMALSPDGERLALARGSRLDLWETRDGRHVQQWQLATELTALAFAPSRERPLLALGLRNGLAELWG